MDIVPDKMFQARAAAEEPKIWKWGSAPMLLVIVLPILALFSRSSAERFGSSLQDPVVAMAVQVTLATSLSATVLAVILGAPLAFLLANSRGHARTVLDSITDLPTVLPPSVAGIALLLAFGRKGLLGPALEGAGITIPFTTAAVVLAQLFVAAPFFIKAAAIGLNNIDPELRHAAAIDGANRWQMVWLVELPLAGRALASGAVMTWARAVGEFGATLMFAGNFAGKTQTMPLAIYVGFETDPDAAITLSILLVGAAFVAMLVARSVLRQQFATVPTAER